MEAKRMEDVLVVANGSDPLRIMDNRVEIKAAGEHTGGTFAVMEYAMPPQTPGPPLHLHRRTDEAFYVLEGELTFHLADRSVVAGAGDFVLVPRGVVHTFENAARVGVKFLEVVVPGEFADYFEELADAIRNDGHPDPVVMQELYEKYDIVPAPQEVG
jgi:mannose-6-phosphate isomerase-like protein (cupin superfamily)